MNLDDVDPEFARLMVVLSEGYPTTRLREGTVRFYARQLGDLPVEVVARAMDRASKECRFFPTCADVRAYVVPTGEDLAMLAWTALAQAARDVGAYASLELEDACAAEALRLVFGTWPAYCDLDTQALNFRRAEFLAAYRQARRDAAENAHPARLAGLCEATGNYRALPIVWAGRVTYSGAVRLIIDRGQLAETAQLTLGTGER